MMPSTGRFQTITRTEPSSQREVERPTDADGCRDADKDRDTDRDIHTDAACNGAVIWLMKRAASIDNNI